MPPKYCPACGEEIFENCTNLACPLGLEYIRTNFTGEYDALRCEFSDEAWEQYLAELNQKLPSPPPELSPAEQQVLSDKRPAATTLTAALASLRARRRNWADLAARPGTHPALARAQEDAWLEVLLTGILTQPLVRLPNSHEAQPPFCVYCGVSEFICSTVAATDAFPACCPQCTHADAAAARLSLDTLNSIIAGLAEGETWDRINGSPTPVFQALVEFRDALHALAVTT